MKWLEFSVTTDGEAAEAVVELFNRHSQGRAVVETSLDCFEYELAEAPGPADVIVRTYLPLDSGASESRRRLEEGLWHLRQIYPFPEPDIRELAEEDWTEAWKRQYHLLRLGQRTVIVPAWEAYAPALGEIAIRLEPGMAFGTGLHPTTRLCLEALERHLVPDSTVLDVGTGSGILAIAAAKLGARAVLALDADPVAVEVARENAAMNGVDDRVTVRYGSLPGSGEVSGFYAARGEGELLKAGRFDLVLINILAPVIVGMAPALAARLGSGGRIIAAGLIESQEGDVASALQGQKLEIIERAQEKDWVLLVVQRR